MKFMTIYVSGQAELEAKIQGLAHIDTQAILDEGAAIIFNRMRSRFLRETDPTGVRWPQSKAAQRRAKSGRGGGTLFDVGKLFPSLQLYSVGTNQRAIGTNASNLAGFPYPVVHNFGLAGFPMRQFLGFGNDDVKLMSDVVIKHILEQLTKK